jgi:hypothetical protein
MVSVRLAAFLLRGIGLGDFVERRVRAARFVLLGMTVKMTVKPNRFEKRARRGNALDVPLMIEWE